MILENISENIHLFYYVYIHEQIREWSINDNFSRWVERSTKDKYGMGENAYSGEILLLKHIQ